MWWKVYGLTIVLFLSKLVFEFIIFIFFFFFFTPRLFLKSSLYLIWIRSEPKKQNFLSNQIFFFKHLFKIQQSMADFFFTPSATSGNTNQKWCYRCVKHLIADNAHFCVFFMNSRQKKCDHCFHSKHSCVLNAGFLSHQILMCKATRVCFLNNNKSTQINLRQTMKI